MAARLVLGRLVPDAPFGFGRLGRFVAFASPGAATFTATVSGSGAGRGRAQTGVTSAAAFTQYQKRRMGQDR